MTENLREKPNEREFRGRNQRRGNIKEQPSERNLREKQSEIEFKGETKGEIIQRNKQVREIKGTFR